MSIQEAIALHRAGRLAEAERAYRSLLAANPEDPDALHFYGVLRAQGGDLEGAIDLIGRSLAVDPDAPQAHFHYANALTGAGRKAEALAHYERALALQPGYQQALIGHIGALIDLGRGGEALAQCRQSGLAQNPQVCDLTGRALMATKKHPEALVAFDAALALKSDFVDARYHRADALHALKRNEEALAELARVLAVKPDFAEAHLARANVQLACERPKQALEASDAALALAPGLYEAHLVRGEALVALNRFEDALAAFDTGVALRPDEAKSHNSRGGVLIKLGRAEEALAAFERALALDPDFDAAIINRGSALVDLDRTEEAQTAFASAIERDPKSHVAAYNLANLHLMQNRLEQALTAFDRTIALKPDWVEAHYNRACALDQLDRKDECLTACEQALAIDPRLSLARGKRLTIRAGQCDWRGRAEDVAELKRLCDEEALLDPFATIFAFDDPVLHLKAARAFAGPVRPHAGSPRKHGRLKLAYMSPDFREHPVANQIAELLERHDRSRFELAGICVQSDPASPIRSRLKHAFEHFHEAQQRTDAGIAGLIKELEIDIVVDLGGYTDKGRTKALSWRPAPIAVNYLGYSGTLGAGYVDYIVADACVLPPEHEAFFSEKIVRLPHCFFPSDSHGRGAAPPTRAEEGLPQDAFVFCTFNNAYKITPELFDIWMRLLKQVEKSVLWLRVEKPLARNNLRGEAERRGISPERLIFAERAPRERHLARIALADLFLDSTPYNAHTTCNDALWAGLPLVTCPGRSFASRVAASMLTVSEVEELIVPDLASYEALALALARSPGRLQALRRKLTEGRGANPLFDTEGLCRGLEEAYRTMWDIHAKGQNPHSFSVNMGTVEG